MSTRYVQMHSSIARYLLGSASIIAVGCAAGMTLGGKTYIGDMLTSILPHTGVVLFLLAGMAVCMGCYRTSGVLLGTLGVLAYVYVTDTGLLPAFPYKECATCTTETIQLFQYNVLFDNAGLAKFVAWGSEQTQYDILVLQEVTGAHQEALTPLEKLYPYVFWKKGVAVYSRLPMILNTQHTISGRHLQLVGQTRQHMIPFHLTAVHARSPRTKSAWQQRNRTLEQIGMAVQNSPLAHHLVVGDMNITPHSFWFKHLIKLGHVHTVQGYIQSPTWRPSRHMPWWAGIRIDHVLGTAGRLHLVYQGAGPDFGSDHRPVITKVVFNKKDKLHEN